MIVGGIFLVLKFFLVAAEDGDYVYVEECDDLCLFARWFPGAIGILVGLCIIGIVIFSIIFGCCALCGYPLKICKTTEAPHRGQRVQPSPNIYVTPQTTSHSVPTSSDPPPSYIEVHRNIDSNKSRVQADRYNTPPPSYSSLA